MNLRSELLLDAWRYRYAFVQGEKVSNKKEKTNSDNLRCVSPVVVKRGLIRCSHRVFCGEFPTRKMANLPVEGHLGSPLMPAPAPQSDTKWSTRPLTSTEITAMLRSLVGVFDDPKLTSHSLKTTCLSWCAKADVSRDRRILGRHTSALVDADSIYSRDLMYGPVVSLEKVMSAICDNPDAPRSQYWPTAMPICRQEWSL